MDADDAAAAATGAGAGASAGAGAGGGPVALKAEPLALPEREGGGGRRTARDGETALGGGGRAIGGAGAGALVLDAEAADDAEAIEAAGVGLMQN